MIATINKTMTKEQLDNYWTKNHKQITQKIKFIKFKSRPHTQWELDEFISLIYCHLVDYLDKLNNDNIESFIINYGKKNIMWERSTINMLYDNKKIEYAEQLKDSTTNEDDEKEIEIKIAIEQYYAKQKTISEMFRLTLSLPERVLFDAIYKDGHTTVKQLMEKFKINRTYLQKMKKDLQIKFKMFVENVEKEGN